MSNIFLSYSHEDRVWKERLEKHLKPLARAKGQNYSIWTDDQIMPGEDWEKSIQITLNSAKVAVLLVTKHFLTSRFVNEKEVPRLLARRREEGIFIVPIIVKPCVWKNIDWLASIQCRPRGGEPLSLMNEENADAALVEIAQEIARILEEYIPQSPPPPPAPKGIGIQINQCSSDINFGMSMDEGLLLSTRENHFFWIDLQHSLVYAHSSLTPFSAFLQKSSNEGVFALYDKKLAFFKSNEQDWSFINLPNPAFSLAIHAETLFVGDTQGMVFTLPTEGGFRFWPSSIKEPVLQLLPIEETKVIALGSSGHLWLLSSDSTAPKRIQISDQNFLSDPVLQACFISGANPSEEILLMYHQALVLFNWKSGEINESIFPLPLGSTDMFRKITPSKSGKYFGLLTDNSNIYIVPNDLHSPVALDFSESIGSNIVDISPHPNNGFWIWTTEGKLYHVSSNGSFKKMQIPPVQYAFSSIISNNSYAVWKINDEYFIGEHPFKHLQVR